MARVSCLSNSDLTKEEQNSAGKVRVGLTNGGSASNQPRHKLKTLVALIVSERVSLTLNLTCLRRWQGRDMVRTVTRPVSCGVRKAALCLYLFLAM